MFGKVTWLNELQSRTRRARASGSLNSKLCHRGDEPIFLFRENAKYHATRFFRFPSQTCSAQHKPYHHMTTTLQNDGIATFTAHRININVLKTGFSKYGDMDKAESKRPNVSRGVADRCVNGGERSWEKAEEILARFKIASVRRISILNDLYRTTGSTDLHSHHHPHPYTHTHSAFQRKRRRPAPG